jgi:hypothetical protein
MGGLARTIAVIDDAARVLASLQNLLASFGYKAGRLFHQFLNELDWCFSTACGVDERLFPIAIFENPK